jgi:hypothetical protein
MLFKRLLAVVEIQYGNLWNSKIDHTRVAKVEIISRGIRASFRNVAYIHPFTSPATKNAQREQCNELGMFHHPANLALFDPAVTSSAPGV